MKTIVQFPHKALRKVTEPIDFSDRTFNHELFQDLLDIYFHKRPYGIAAPQIDVNKQVFVALGHLYINPRIIHYSSIKKEAYESCLSLTERVLVSRSVAITIDYSDKRGFRLSTELTGTQARVFQHEYDHLMGKLIIDYKEK